jgi:DNA-binding IclR family transcriptional regulator
VPVPPVRALSRGLAVVEAMAGAAAPLGPREVAELTGLDPATTSRLLGTLVDEGYVKRAGQGKYALTSKLLVLAASAGVVSGLRDVARPVMQELRDSYEETIHLGIVEDDRVVYIEKLEPAHQRVALVTAVGQSMPVHSTALGKAILAELPPAARDAILDRVELTARTPETITTRPVLLAELERTHRQGYGVDHGENLPDASCVAAPIWAGGGEVTAALSMSSPTFRIADRFTELGPVVRAAADRISAALGPA